MKLTKNVWLCGAGRRMKQNPIVVALMSMALLGMAQMQVARAQAVSTTTVQGTVYLANGQAGSGTLLVSWPAFTTANGLAVAADSLTATIGPDGFVSVKLAPNLGATPAGLFYTAVIYMSDGTTSTQYWVVPSAAQASLGQVQSQLMPAAQAVHAVSKAYVDQAISELTQSLLMASGGTLSGPLYLNGDPTQALQASDKHYVDSAVSKAVPLAGGNMTGALGTPAVNGVQSPASGSSQTTLQSAMTAAGSNGAMEIPPTYSGIDGFTNPNGVRVTDLRTSGAQPTERSAKEFGAVCDGVTDDTNALQAALNYAQTHGVALTIPQGRCKTRTLSWHGESIGGMGKQVSALLGFPGQDVLASQSDSPNLLEYTRLHDLTIYVDQSADVSCSPAEGRAPAGSCAISRPLESNSIFSQGGNGLLGTTGSGAGWAVGNCAIAMPAAMGTGGNGLRVAEIENVEIATTGVDPMAAQYPGAHSTHTCGMYLAQWPQWSEFRNIDIRGLNTGIAMPALPGTTPAGLNADSNRWQNITIQATHGFTSAAGSNNVLDNVVVLAGNSAATGEPPTGLVLDLTGTQQGWTVRNEVVIPTWNAVQPQLTLTAAGGTVTAVSIGSEHGLGFDPYGSQVPLQFSGSCTAAATANVNSDGSIGTINVTQGGASCSGTTTASVNVAGTWDTAAPVNLIGGQNMTLFAGNLLKGNGGYTVWNAAGSESYGTQLNGGGGSLPGGGTYAALVGSNRLGTTYQVDKFPGADFGSKLQTCLGAVSTAYGGNCDARNFTGNLSMGSNLTISTANTTVQLPCATIATSNQIIVTAGTRNVALRGCALRGGSIASGSQGGTAFAYSGTGAMVQVGDPTYTTDTQGFHMDDVVINTTAATSAAAQGLVAYRTQEMDLESLYFLGNANQTGMTLDGTGNYTGGTYFDNAFNGFKTAVNAIGHQVSNPATTDWMNASTFVRLHINCPTSGGNPIGGTVGINLQQGDGNTFTGGDVEGCATALHLGANAQNNTIVGLRNENSNSQIVADAGSAYNNWMTGGTMFLGKLTDNGTRNSFLDTFHRSFNGMNGDWYGSQQDATVTNHFRLGTAMGNERGLLNRYQTDYGYRWTMGLSDAIAGEQFYQVLDELNNVYRLSIGQYNNGQASTNNQTVVNAAGTGSVVLNGSTNSGTGGVVFGSGGANASSVATIDNAGNAQFNGAFQVGGPSTFTSSTTAKNQADAEIDEFLWAGATTSQKESLTYKDWNGTSQWYAMKDASNNWALNSATGGLDSFKAYQSANSGDTYINASNATGAVRVNYESGAGTAFKIYGGGSSSLYASFTGINSIQFPGLAAGSGHNCLQIDNSGYVSNTGTACGAGSGGGGTVGTGNSGQIAYYTADGTSVGGMSAVPLAAGGTGAATAAGALQNLGGISSSATTRQTLGGVLGWTETANAQQTLVNMNGRGPVINVLSQGVVAGGTLGNSLATDSANTTAMQGAINAAMATHGELYFPCGIYNINGPLTVYGVVSISMVGQSWLCTTIQYTGAVSVTRGMITVAGTAVPVDCTSVSCDSSTTGIPSVGATGFQMEDITLLGNTQVPDGLDLIEATQFHIRDVLSLGAGNASFYLQSSMQGQMDEPLTSYNALYGLGGFSANPTPNGIVLDGRDFGFSTNVVMINSQTSNIMPGKAVWIRQGNSNIFNNCQISGNGVNIQIDDGMDNQFNNCMSEGGPFNLLSGAQNNTITASYMAGAIHISGAGNHFTGGQIGFTTIDSTAVSTVLDHVNLAEGSASITDNAPDTEYRSIFDAGTSQTVSSVLPAWRKVPPAIGGGWTSNPIFLTGQWTTSGAASNLDPAPLGNLWCWRAVFSGEWMSSTGYDYQPTTYEFTGSNPTLTLNSGQIVTVTAITGGHLQFAATTGHVWFSGSITFYPNAGGLSAYYNSPVSMPQLNVGANTVIPATTTGYHGSSGTKLQLSDGTGSSGDYAKFSSDGSVADGGAGSLEASVSGIRNGNGAGADTAANSHDLSGPANCLAASGSGTSYTCSTLPTFTPSAGDHIQLKADVANTGSATLAVNGASAAAIKKLGGSGNLSANDLLAGHWVSATFDGTSWQLEGQLGQINATKVNGIALAGLATGLVKNTTGTGVPTIAVAGTDYALPNANTTGTAAGLSGVSALPNGTWATTQNAGDNSTKVATTAYVATAVPSSLPPNGSAGGDLSGSYPGPTVAKINGAGVPASKAQLATDASGHIVAAANTLGCLDGYDHLPCIVYVQSNVSESTATGSYSTAWTSTNAGTYRITGYIYGTTAGSTAYSVSNYVKATQTGQSSGNGYLVASSQIGTTISSGYSYVNVFPLNAGTAVQTESLTASGSNTGGAWSRAIIVERLQ